MWKWISPLLAFAILGFGAPAAQADASADLATGATRNAAADRGRWKTVRVREWRAPRWERIWVEPIYGYRRDRCGATVRVVVRHGYWDRHLIPGHHVWVTKKIRVRGHRGHPHRW